MRNISEVLKAIVESGNKQAIGELKKVIYLPDKLTADHEAKYMGGFLAGLRLALDPKFDLLVPSGCGLIYMEGVVRGMREVYHSHHFNTQKNKIKIMKIWEKI